MKSKLIVLICLCFCALLLISIALLNGYPLVYWDTGTYVGSGFNGTVPFDRPILYGLFIRHISLASSLWLVIFAQGLIVSLLCFFACKYFTSVSTPVLLTVIAITLLVYFTGIGIHASRIVPDIFTSLSILSLTIILAAQRIKKIHAAIIVLIFVFSNLVHLSNMTTILGVLCVITLYNILHRRKYHAPLINNKRIYFGWGLLVCSYILLGSINFLYTKSFFISKAGHVFIMARMSDNGILQQYLNDKCVEKNYKICNYKDSIPGDFIWDTRGPLYKIYNLPNAYANWEANTKEYWEIITGTLTETKYLKKHVQCFLETTAKQLGKFDSGTDVIPHTTEWPVLAVIKYHFPRDFKDYLNSSQSLGKLGFSFLQQRQRIVILFSLVLLSVCLLIPTVRHALNNTSCFAAIIIILTSLIINAMVCGNLSAPDHRFQNRVIWLLPFLILLVVANKNVRVAMKKWIKNLLAE